MVNLNIIEDRPTPNAVYNCRVYFSASVAAFAAVMIGYVSKYLRIGVFTFLLSFAQDVRFQPWLYSFACVYPVSLLRPPSLGQLSLFLPSWKNLGWKTRALANLPHSRPTSSPYIKLALSSAPLVDTVLDTTLAENGVLSSQVSFPALAYFFNVLPATRLVLGSCMQDDSLLVSALVWCPIWL